jgi:hypothetical protein
VVVGRHWRKRGSELAFVTRSVAGAASRTGPVAILVPGPVSLREPDGAFELRGLGEDASLVWPADLSSDCPLIVDQLSPDIMALRSGGLTLSAVPEGSTDHSWRGIPVVDGAGEPPVGLFVPINPLAAQHRHHGFGFTGYVLVLSDRSIPEDGPPQAVAWLTAAFHDLYVVVVEHATASAWKGRSLRGTTSVDTRMDLWRLMAHAVSCVDLGPGPLLARECVEALRLGTPIIVPEGAPSAAVHARAGGGSTFSDAWELLEATERYRNEAGRASAAVQGLEYADAWFGDPAGFVKRLAGLLGKARD